MLKSLLDCSHHHGKLSISPVSSSRTLVFSQQPFSASCQEPRRISPRCEPRSRFWAASSSTPTSVPQLILGRRFSPFLSSSSKFLSRFPSREISHLCGSLVSLESLSDRPGIEVLAEFQLPFCAVTSCMTVYTFYTVHCFTEILYLKPRASFVMVNGRRSTKCTRSITFSFLAASLRNMPESAFVC